SKTRIMELYFMWAEWGKGVFGIEAASRMYYKTSVYKLSLDSQARLIAILSSPVRFTPFTLGKHAQLRWRYDYLIRKYAQTS
ncbi:MAG TPA: transglycosylase domain-containing protein, partial [Spirochaetales bacterium]|nr:transglycosylase domain-containing protein [Spirochaetales bacterium]